jgi:AraC-like DNA-binding protein
MEFLQSLSHPAIVPVHEVPPNYEAYRIIAARANYLKNSFGDYLTQIMTGKRCSAQYNIFNIVRKSTLDPYSSQALMTIHFMLQGYIPCILRGFGKVVLQQGFYHLFYVPPGIRHQARFRKGTYFSFHVDLSRELLEDLAVNYPELQEVLHRFDQHSAKGIQQHAAHITPRIRFMIDEIITQCPVTEPNLSLFLESRTQQFLLKYVRDKPIDKTTLPHNSVLLMENIIAYITAHLDYRHTIASLSREFALSEMTLKRHFKAYTGQTVYEFITDKRMDEAKRLLTTTWSIRDIAMQVGYDDFSSFDRVFTHKYGHPPSYYRK